MRTTLASAAVVLSASIGLSGCGAADLTGGGSPGSGGSSAEPERVETATVTETVEQSPTEAETSEAASSEAEGTTVIEDDENVINPCQTSDLEVLFESAEYMENGGSGFGGFTVTNTSSEPCSIEGYPKVQMMSSGIRAIPTTSEPIQPGPSFVRVDPGKGAFASVEWWITPYSDSPNTGCVERPAGLVLSLPGQSTPDDGIPLEVAVNTPDGATPMNPCHDGILEVGAFKASDG